MSEGLPYADIVILALIAGFVLLRLRSVLGQKGIGLDSPPHYGEYRRAEEESPIVQVEKNISLAQENENLEEDKRLINQIADSSARQGIETIAAADKDFSLKEFNAGAKAAFEMVFDAFAKSDMQTLRMLLSNDLYNAFSAEIDARRNQPQRAETTLLAVTEQEISAAELHKNTARITVRFVSEQVSVVRDADGKIVEGNPTHSDHVEDAWTFERDITSRNPNWKIIDT